MNLSIDLPMTKKVENDSEFIDLQQKIEILMRNTEEPFVLVDRDLTIVAFNEEFKYQYFKYFSVQVSKGHSILDYAKSGTEALKEIYKKAFEGIRTESELTIPVTENISHTVLIKYKPALNETGKIFGAFVSIIDITEKKQAIESNNRFQSLIENANEIISLTDKAGKLIYLSPSIYKITGYCVDELKEVKDLVDKMHPDSKANSGSLLEEVLQNPGVPVYRLHRLMHKNGSIIWLEGTVTNLLDNENVKAIVSNFRDITEKKVSEERLKESENNLKAIFNNSNEGLMLLDTDFRIKVFNAKADDNKPYVSRPLKVGDNLVSYVEEPRQEYFITYLNRVLQGETIEYDTHYSRDEDDLWFHATLSPVRENSMITGICLTRRNISARKKIEEELKASEERYRLLSEELAVSNTELEQFAYTASHDLQEPLRMITSFLNQLELKYKEQLDDKAQQYIYFATDGAARLRKIILDLLEYSLAGKKTIDLEVVDTEMVLAESLQLLRKTIEEKNADIIHGPMPTLPANKSSLLQIFQNLIGNGLKYQKNGQKPVLKINAVETDTHWQFSFADNGIGIESQFFEKIFVAFHRLHNRSEYAGTGLGLAICKKIVENHGGRVWLESIPGEGSTFYFTLIK